MKKQELLDVIELEVTDERFITFIELLDDGRKNKRTLYTYKSDVLDIITNLFDDNLHGNVRDGLMTTIVSYTFE